MKFARAAIAVLCLGVHLSLAQSADEQYIRIYQGIQEADRLNEAGQGRAAATKYLEVQTDLRRFQSVYPGWNDRVVNFRLSYIAGKLAPLTPALASGQTNAVGSSSNIAATHPATAPGGISGGAVPPATLSVTETQQQLAALQSEVERLQADNRLLGAKLKEALSVQPAASDPRELAKAEDRIRSLGKENDLLTVRLRAATNNASPALTATLDLQSRIAEQSESIAALRAENEFLRRQNAEQKKIGTEARPDASAAPALTGVLQEKDGTIRKLNEDLLALQKEVALLKERERLLGSGKPLTTDDSEQLLQNLRARLQVLEAAPVPYTREELALLDKDGMTLAYAKPATATPATQPPPAEGTPRPRKASKDIPPGAGQLVAAAERAFFQRNYAEAESKYLDVLRQDEDNVSTLANLASTQLELGKIDEAEKSAQRALALDPEDHFALYVVGRIRFRQERLDEALDLLSRSAKANPEYAEAQNYLGIVLSEKGLRIPAEAALRKAVQLQPGHAAAHNNLAVVYATQKPPSPALARWHYQKALAAGHPRNPELEKLLEQK